MAIVLSPGEIRESLREATAAVLRSDDVHLDMAKGWLESATARDLLRIDGVARQYRYDSPTLGKSQQWTRRVLARSMSAAALASMHPDEFIRERAVRQLASSGALLSDRMLAVRAGDQVPEVRELARQALMDRTGLPHAARIMPVLHRFEARGRGSEIRTEYLDALISLHGERSTWNELRASKDRDLRRTAFQRGVDRKLLATTDAVEHLPRERDQVVRRLLAQVIADNAEPSTIRAVLLKARAAESRVLGLVKLKASQLDPAEVEPLLTDSSVLVRVWARRRWQEMGNDVLAAYRDAIRMSQRPTKRALAYLGLTEAGGVVDRPETLDLIHSPEPALQKVGLRLLADKAQHVDVPKLFALFKSEHSHVARLAGDVLAHHSGFWDSSQLAEMKNDPDPVIRRRSWWLRRSRRDWESVIADLEILKDPDHRLAILGRRPAVPMYFPASDAQRDLIADLLPDAPISREEKLVIALAAGLKDLMAELRSSPRWPQRPKEAEVPKTEQPNSWWQRLLGRG
jgi:hypothetical protein